MAIWWTEDDIAKVVRQVLASDTGRSIVRQHVDTILREEATRAIGAELRTTAELLAEQVKTTLQRKLNAAYATQAERLTSKLVELERSLEAAAPAQEMRLKAFENRIEEVSAAIEGWLDEPTRSLVTLCNEGAARFTAEVNNIMKKSALKMQGTVEHAKQRVDRMMQTKLHTMVVAAVREHVRSVPFEEDRLSNKQIAAAMGVSLRGAKRLRRAGMV